MDDSKEPYRVTFWIRLSLYTWEPQLWLLLRWASWTWPRTKPEQNKRKQIRLKAMAAQLCVFLWSFGKLTHRTHKTTALRAGKTRLSQQSVCGAYMGTWVSFPKLKPDVSFISVPGRWRQAKPWDHVSQPSLQGKLHMTEGLLSQKRWMMLSFGW